MNAFVFEKFVAWNKNSFKYVKILLFRSEYA